MIDTEELMKLRAAKPYLFDIEDPQAGLAAVQRAANEYKLMLRAIGTLKRSYSARITRSPHLNMARPSAVAEVQAKAAELQANLGSALPNVEHRLASEDETEAFIAEMAEAMKNR